MEVFMRNINFLSNQVEIVHQLAQVLHGPDFAEHNSLARFNFHVHLHRDKRGIRAHGGTGSLTLPTRECGNLFLSLFGTPTRKTFALRNKRVTFQASRNPSGRADVLESIRLLPYVDPRVIQEKERRAAQLNASRVSIRVLQFGWECRDDAFSIESETQCAGRCGLFFDDERRELRIKLRQSSDTYVIAIRFSQLLAISAHTYLSETPVIFLSLNQPPTYECEGTGGSFRQRLSFLPILDHERVAPYASLAIRLICASFDDLQKFRDLSLVAQLHNIQDYECPVVRRGLFSQVAMDELQDWQRRFDWSVSFQIEAILRSMGVDARELLDLMPEVRRVIRANGKEYAAGLLRYFEPRARALFRNPVEEYEGDQGVTQCFLSSEIEYEKQKNLPSLKPTEGSLYEALHVIITPTTMFLEGPFPERSNRIVRSFDAIHQESFLRVSFVDEGRLQYRFDREVDGPAFIRARVGPFLLQGLTIARRTFYFLAYSQSALKEHAVWFVKPFRDSQQGLVTAETIIQKIGTFENLEFDPKLIYCPARYAARLSQAFTATDASVSVEVEEIFHIPDIATTDQKYVFTDGVGTISKEMAREMWLQLTASTRRKRGRRRDFPRAFQVRFMGSKGMLSVDHGLQGRAVCLRPSMIKFEAPESREMEIARAFDRPGPYFLNRPLIMLLEGLGVPYEVFESYQDQAVKETHSSTECLAKAAKLLESYGLGTSFRLPSVLHNLEKIGIDSLPGNKFYDKMLEYAINHILRLLKNHARIPIPGAWTLVGVADVHKFLQPGQIFACIKPITGGTLYLEGQVLVSRSPTIHPGDVQLATAIGRPPLGSCFEKESLANTVVFSILGERPLSTCLGGGDLDGDVYNLIPLDGPLADFQISPREPASYNPAPKNLLDRPSTMADVAEFVMQYINSDVVGIIAINWLIIADQSPQGIHDRDCIELANLHSDAVDYPKSGQPVALDKIPKLKHRMKPDWNAPETINPDSGNFYPSQRAIGRLFRAIELPADHQIRDQPRRQRRTARRNNRRAAETLPDLTDLNLGDDDPLLIAVEERVGDFIDPEEPWVEEMWNYTNDLFSRYSSELQMICAANTLSHARTAHLSEEEAIIGTIIQKSSQPRKRKDLMSKLREQTDVLIRGIREEWSPEDDDTPLEDCLEKVWLAWNLSLSKGKVFGAQSFGWVALGAIFEVIRQIEERIMEESRNRFY